MLNFSLNDLDSSQAIFGLIVFFIINIILNLFLVNKFLEERRKNRILRKSTPSAESGILDFITKQFNGTKSHNRIQINKDRKLYKEVVHLRTAYLKIEEKAISHTIDSVQYWHYLNENLLKLIKIIFPQGFRKNSESEELERKLALMQERINKIPSSENNSNVDRNKAKAIASLEKIRHQQKNNAGKSINIDKHLKKLENIVDIFETSESRKNYLFKKKHKIYFDNSQKHSEQLDYLSRKNAETLATFSQSLESNGGSSDEINRFKDENSNLTRQIAQLKKELHSFQERISSSDDIGDFFDEDKKWKENNELQDITAELIESNEKEIDRLRDVISNQRHSIFEMEESLNKLEELNQTNDGGNQSEIDKLKRCIQESEVCISMLEKELDDLKVDLAEFKAERHNSGLNNSESEALSNEVIQLKSEIEASNQQAEAFEQFNNFTSEALSASSIEDISLLLYEKITSMNYSPQVLIKSPERTLELAAKGTISVREKVMVNNMQIDEINPGSQGQLTFRFLHIAGIIQPAESAELTENDQQLLIKILKLTDKVINFLAFAQKIKRHAKARDETINAIKHASFDMDKLIEEHSNKSKKIINRNFEQILDIARAKGMNATQVAMIHSIEQETLKQIEAANTLRLKSRKDYLKLIKTIEDSD